MTKARRGAVAVENELSAPTPYGEGSGTPPQYGLGAVKQDPLTMAVAVRTNILDPDGLKDWGIMTVDRGGHYAHYDEVSTWTDKP